MGIAGVREAFNEISAPGHVCEMAFLTNERSAGREWSRLKFRGISAAGAAFEVNSDLLPGGTDVNEAARQVAQKLVNEGG